MESRNPVLRAAGSAVKGFVEGAYAFPARTATAHPCASHATGCRRILARINWVDVPALRGSPTSPEVDGRAAEKAGTV